MRRVVAKFVPKLLNCDQKLHRKNIANEMLDSVRDDPNLIQRVITGDEAWIYGYDVETKAQSSQWKLPHEPRPKKARQVRSNVKVFLTVFFDCRGVVHHEFLPQGRTVNKEYYLTQVLSAEENSAPATVNNARMENVAGPVSAPPAGLKAQGEVNNGIEKMRNEISKVKINKIIKSKSGVILKVDSGENLNILIEEFKKIDEVNQKALIYAPKPLDPTIVLKSITKSTDIKELPSILCNMNPELEGREKKIKLGNQFVTGVQHRILRQEDKPPRKDKERKKIIKKTSGENVA
ncbi:hypothetical protein LAZ67_2005887 [Cordylochernes scorpioides]|uniref:Transposase n=1 Tax=Cordylochernes scorpioides TaxID=51811 RepID=A0ABY6K6G3_9ARAC|nr:hypothetical protein LAZ67_2005887 [Cordylochernes scorpioides]